MKKSLLLSFLMICHVFSLQNCSSQEKVIDQALKEQILHLSNTAEVATIDPALATGDVESRVINQIFEGLVVYHPKTLEPMPGVAKSWDVSEDGLTYTFYLRQDAKWSNGDPVTAKDFAYSWQRTLLPSFGSEYAYIMYPIKNSEAFNKGQIKDFDEVGIKVLNDHTLKVELSYPTPYFLKVLCFKTFAPIHKATIEKHGTIDQRDSAWTRAENIVSNGPFRVQYWTINHKMILEKNPHYWDIDKVKLKEVHFYPIENPTDAEKSLRAGKLHAIGLLPVNKIKTYEKKYPDRLRMEPYLTAYYYILNIKVKPLDDVRVRKALALSINRELLAKHVAKNSEKPAYNLTPPNTGGYTSKSKTEFNIQKAKELLKEAGYPNGEGFPKLSLLYNIDELHRDVAEAIQQMWKKNLGINIELRNQEWKVYLSSIRKGDYQIARRGWVGDYPDPNTFLDMFTTGNDMNLTGFASARYDQIIKDAAKIQDQTKRFELFQEASRMLIEEMPFIPIFHRLRTYAVHPDVHGWHSNILNVHPLKEVYLKRK